MDGHRQWQYPFSLKGQGVKMLNIAIQMLRTIYQLSQAYMMCVQTSHDYNVPVSSLQDQQYSNLTHWGRVTHICVGKLNIIGSDNGLSPRRRQAIIWTNAGILLIRPLGTKFNEILFRNQTFSFKKMHLKMSSAKWRPFCLGLRELIWYMKLIDPIERNDDLHTLSPCLTHLDNVLMTSQSIADDVTMTRQLWHDHVKSDI